MPWAVNAQSFKYITITPYWGKTFCSSQGGKGTLMPLTCHKGSVSNEENTSSGYHVTLLKSSMNIGNFGQEL